MRTRVAQDMPLLRPTPNAMLHSNDTPLGKIECTTGDLGRPGAVLQARTSRPEIPDAHAHHRAYDHAYVRKVDTSSVSFQALGYLDYRGRVQ